MRKVVKDVSGKLSLSAVLLAGGDSTRMGTNKALLQIRGKPLIEIIFKKLEQLFLEVIIVTDRVQEFEYLPAKITSDIYHEGKKNALRGIHAGLTFSSAPASFVVACDMPFISRPLIYYMSRFALDFDLVVPHYEGYFQPLFAFYNKTTLEPITRALIQKDYKIFDLYTCLNVKEINEDVLKFFDPCYLSFFNVNSREDYLKAKQYVSEKSGTSSQLE